LGKKRFVKKGVLWGRLFNQGGWLEGETKGDREEGGYEKKQRQPGGKNILENVFQMKRGIRETNRTSVRKNPFPKTVEGQDEKSLGGRDPSRLKGKGTWGEGLALEKKRREGGIKKEKRRKEYADSERVSLLGGNKKGGGSKGRKDLTKETRKTASHR